MTSHPSAIISWKELFMKCWKVTGVGKSEEHYRGFEEALVDNEAAFH
jgi:hypothetical protein